MFGFDLTATMFKNDNRYFLLNFKNFVPEGFYVVKGTILARPSEQWYLFEVVPIDEQSLTDVLGLVGESPDENLKKFIETKGQSGIVIRVIEVNPNIEFPPPARGFMVEISFFGRG